MYICIYHNINMNIMEIWKNIEGYEGLYQVSNEGRVKSLEREVVYVDGRKKIVKEKILHNILNGLGYCHVMLSKNGGPKRYKVHRLVAQAFIPNPNGYPIINHKDENPKNNVVSNLEWCDQNYNVHYGTMIERGRLKQQNRSDLSKAVEQYTLDGKLVGEYASASEVERINPEFKTSSVTRCCRGGQMLNGMWQSITSYKGFIWKYKNE